MPHPYAHHATARDQAFSWYRGPPPSIDKARLHFTSKAVRDPAHRALYAEALDIFLATCWNVQPPAQKRARSDRFPLGQTEVAWPSPVRNATNVEVGPIQQG